MRALFLIGSALICLALISAGCTSPTPCINQTIQHKEYIQQTNNIGLVIDDTFYPYYNPNITVYGLIIENKTYPVRFYPMFTGEYRVALCSDPVGW